MSTNNKISTVVSRQLPFFVRNDHPKFVDFLEAYYSYLEQTDNSPVSDGKILERIHNLTNYLDIDRTLDDLAEKLYERFLKYFPKTNRVNRITVLKHAKDFYRSKGTEKSVRFLVRVVTGTDEVSVYYPKKDILRASDGKWFIQKSLHISNTSIDNVETNSYDDLLLYVNSRIYGNTSNATAIIERIDRFYEGSSQVDELLISSQNGNFVNGERVTANVDIDGVTKTLSSIVFGGILNSLSIEIPGSGYEIGDPLTFVSANGHGATAYVSDISSGNLTSIVVLYGGAGFKVNDYLLISPENGANANVARVNTSSKYHPNSYNIYYSTISVESNTIIGNINFAYESFAYQNLNTISTNTSNLKINTGSGATVTTINLSGRKANSNVYFETFDSLNVNGTIVLITSSNILSNVITVSPGLPGNLISNTFIVIKKANLYTTLENAIPSYVYSNTGPAELITILAEGSDFLAVPDMTIIANNMIASLGILGRLEIIDGGLGYRCNDTIEFTNVIGGYGFGALAEVTANNANGRITEVKFKSVTGQIIGGSGYSQDKLPIATVNSTNTLAHSAIITANAILGAGEILTAGTGDIGAITDIIITSRGEGYDTAPIVDLTGYGDGTAQVTATVISGVYTYPGRYLNDDGHLSAYNFLQNRDYYQNYSYVVRTRSSVKDYEKAILDLAHPAGMKLFGEFLYENIDQEDANTEISEIEDSIQTITLTGTYAKFANNINITFYNAQNYGIVEGANVILEFLTGNLSNVKNGIYMISSVATVNSFNVVRNAGVMSLSINNAGSGYSSNGYLIFTGGSGANSNALFRINSTGSITEVIINERGSGYKISPVVTANGTNTIMATFDVITYSGNTSGTVNVSIDLSTLIL